VWERVPATLLVVGTGTLLAMCIGLPSGIYAGWRREKFFDKASTTIGMVFYSIPTLWIGMVLIMIFAVGLGWFPVGRMSDPGAHLSGTWESLTSIASHLVLPALTFGMVWAGQYQIIMRTSVSGVMNEDFVLTAHAKGLHDGRVLWRHVVPNAMLPTFTVIMMNLGFVMSGAILTETVFNWPGIGLLAYESMLALDFPVMQAVFLLASVAVILMNLIAEVVYPYLDPRVES
jgi:peptide/nickel transport system permease protein